MSGYGLVVESNLSRVVVASDGLMWHPEGGIISRDTSKLLKVTDHVLIIWLGIGINELRDQVLKDLHKQGLTEPNEIAERVSVHLQHGFDHPQGREILKNQQFWLCTLGFTSSGELEMYLVFSDAPEDPYTPVKLPIHAGAVGSRAVDLHPHEMPWKELVIQNLQLYRDVVQAVKRSMQEIIDQYSDERQIGGQVFIETIRPPG